MTDAVNHDVMAEDVAPADEAQVSQTQEMAYGNEAHGEDNQSGQTEDDKAQNFKAIRESNARLQKERDELYQRVNTYESRLADIEKSMQAQNRPATQEEIDELADLQSEDWPTREQAEKLAERKARAMYQKMREEDDKKRLEAEKKRQLEELPKKLTKEHPDFESVVTKENVEYLKANKPHIASSLASNSDPYLQALAAYDAIKAFCPNSQVSEENERMEKNASKPGTLGNAKSASPLSRAGSFEKGLTPDLKKQLQSEMIAAIRGS